MILQRCLNLPHTVFGGMYYRFQLISDVPGFMQAIHLLLQRTPTLFEKYPSFSRAFGWSLSEDSPDWYDAWVGRTRSPPLGFGSDWDWDDSVTPGPPFCLQFIQAGSRRGWSWCTGDEDEPHSCEINWLDPEPSSESSVYEAYSRKLQCIERRVDFYRGYHQPPTEEEHRRLCSEGELP
jgi:hypothetical protein